MPGHANANGATALMAPDWMPDRLRKLKDVVDVVEKNNDKDSSGDSLKKSNSIRKRFSTLKLGTKRSKHGLMGGLEEEQ